MLYFWLNSMINFCVVASYTRICFADNLCSIIFKGQLPCSYFIFAAKTKIIGFDLLILIRYGKWYLGLIEVTLADLHTPLEVKVALLYYGLQIPPMILKLLGKRRDGWHWGRLSRGRTRRWQVF